jgi:hypothetical protein
VSNSKKFGAISLVSFLLIIGVLAIKTSVMLWGLLVLIFVVAGVFLFGILRLDRNMRTTTKRLQAQGVLAFAQVVDVTEEFSGDAPTADLDLRIEGPGVAPFNAKEWVNAGGTRGPLIASRRLAVLVDPDTKEFAIDWERSAFVSGAAPLTVTIDEDNRIYDRTGKTALVMEYLRALKINNISVTSQDLRDHPARNQVYAIVRRAGTLPEPVQPAPALPSPPQPSPAERLQQLETMRATGTVSDTEYSAKRRQIIADL